MKRLTLTLIAVAVLFAFAPSQAQACHGRPFRKLLKGAARLMLSGR